jgi:hypothetical protein
MLRALPNRAVGIMGWSHRPGGLYLGRPLGGGKGLCWGWLVGGFFIARGSFAHPFLGAFSCAAARAASDTGIPQAPLDQALRTMMMRAGVVLLPRCRQHEQTNPNLTPRSAVTVVMFNPFAESRNRNSDATIYSIFAISRIEALLCLGKCVCESSPYRDRDIDIVILIYKCIYNI